MNWVPGKYETVAIVEFDGIAKEYGVLSYFVSSPSQILDHFFYISQHKDFFVIPGKQATYPHLMSQSGKSLSG